MQVTQQIFVAEEWVKDARNQAKAEAHSRVEVENPWGPSNKNRRSCLTSWSKRAGPV